MMARRCYAPRSAGRSPGVSVQRCVPASRPCVWRGGARSSPRSQRGAGFGCAAARRVGGIALQHDVATHERLGLQRLIAREVVLDPGPAGCVSPAGAGGECVWRPACRPSHLLHGRANGGAVSAARTGGRLAGYRRVVGMVSAGMLSRSTLSPQRGTKRCWTTPQTQCRAV